jgi:hypothetical protein
MEVPWPHGMISRHLARGTEEEHEEVYQAAESRDGCFNSAPSKYEREDYPLSQCSVIHVLMFIFITVSSKIHDCIFLSAVLIRAANIEL